MRCFVRWSARAGADYCRRDTQEALAIDVDHGIKGQQVVNGPDRIKPRRFARRTRGQRRVSESSGGV